MPTIAETIKKINEFADLPQGWHFGEGVSPSKETRERAKKLLHAASWHGLERSNAFPGVNGQLQVTFYNADRMLELTIENDNSATIAIDKGSTQLAFREGASKAEAYAALEEFSQPVWTSSESFIVNITTQNVITSQVRHWTCQDMNPSPLWSGHVQSPPVKRFAATLPGSTVSSLAVRQFTGAFLTSLFLLGVASIGREPRRETIATTTFTAGLESKHGEHSSH